MDRRNWIFVLTGALFGATATLLFGLSLDPDPVACGGFLTAFSGFCPGSRIEILWFRLSDMELVVWSIIAGALAGALLGLLVDRRYSGQMRAQRTRWGIGTSVILLAALAACSPTPTETSFARYYFEASETRGVLEVTKSPPSICYSTQSIPARPISIVRGSLAASPTAASFAPRENDFCGTVTPALAAGLLGEPSRYSVRWRPLAGEPTALSSFIPIP